MQRINVLIIDDHDMVREGIKFILKDQDKITIIDELDDGIYLNKSLEILTKVDIILMDMNMPKRNGIESTVWLKENFPNIKVIALTLEQDAVSISDMMEAGAHGYVLKNTRKEDFADAIQIVMGGDKYFSNEIAQIMLQNKYSDSISPKYVLSERELEVLNLIAEGFKNAEIGKLLFISPRTVDTHRKNLIEKTDARNTAHLIKLASEHGLLG